MKRSILVRTVETRDGEVCGADVWTKTLSVKVLFHPGDVELKLSRDVWTLSSTPIIFCSIVKAFSVVFFL